MGNVLRFGNGIRVLENQIADRRYFPHVRDSLLGEMVAGTTGDDPVGADGIGADAVPGIFAGDGLGKGDDGSLGGNVDVAPHGAGPDGGHGRHVDDGAATRLDDLRDTVATAEERSEQIQGLGMRPYRHVDVGHRSVVRYRATRAVVQDVELAVASDRRLDGMPDTVLVRYIRLDEGCVAPGLLDQLFSFQSEVSLELRDDDPGTLPSEYPSCRAANSGPRPGNECHFFVESCHL